MAYKFASMHLRSLEQCTIAELTQVFNLAFSDYIVPLALTEEAMKEKIKTENIIPALSAGAFEDEQLVGFILHGYDVIDNLPTVYNAGTGVVPEQRGRGITGLLYQFIIPVLQQKAIHHHVLEVISTNTVAISLYERQGFIRGRELGVYKNAKMIRGNSASMISETAPSATILPGFSSCQPAWQNNTASILRHPEGNKFLSAYDGKEVAGYAVYVPATGRVKQLAVHPLHRRKGIGTALVAYMMQHKQSEAMVFTNVDLACEPVVPFLQSLGFEQLLTQFEMKMVC